MTTATGKTYKVFIIEDAEEDILEIYDYIALTESSEVAENIHNNLRDKCLSLSDMPSRGHIPPELERISIYEYREIHYKPYRIIYQVRETGVYIHCILDGRRELQELLEKRLLRR